MGRDLLHRPSVPMPLGDEETGTKNKQANKLGVKLPQSRDLGGVGAAHPQVKAPAQKAPSQEAGKTAAYKAAYFTQDSSGLNNVNLRASKAAAMRGQEGASDLRKVVLPPAIGVVTPEPTVLRDAGSLMGLDGSIDLNLESLLGRQSAWTQGKGTTAEMIEARRAELEAQVALRVQAMARLMQAGGPQKSVTVAQAVQAQGNALDQSTDVVADGAALIGDTAEGAAGMHARIAKALGIKRPG